MLKRTLPTLLALILVAGAALAGSPFDAPNDGLIVHEWGTFTSIAGDDGLALDWVPAGGPNDLPCFVDSRSVQAKIAYRGPVRMETPVLYFYGNQTEPVDVRVQFAGGSITEWYPSANLSRSDLSTPDQDIIEWNDVQVLARGAEDFPLEPGSSHYYAARATDALPVQVGHETEKFLFYRGVGRFQPPLTATETADGRIRLERLGPDPIEGLIVFENRNGRLGYREIGTLDAPAVVETPALDANLEFLERDLVDLLTGQGLYLPEAEAMVATWNDSWFEDGIRLFYIVPDAAVDRILPLEITPAPEQVARVFVGRMELLTTDTYDAVTDAVRSDDIEALSAYGRFLEPMLNKVTATLELTLAEQRRGWVMHDQLRAAYAADAARCAAASITE